MTTYYVGAGGNDGNTGESWAQRWLTIGQANSTLAAGDEVQIGTSTYAEAIQPSNNGSNGSPITYSAYGNGPVVVTGGAVGGNTYGIYLDNKDYIEVDGLIFEKQDSAATDLWASIRGGSTYCVLQNCIFRATVISSATWGITLNASHYNIIKQCRFEVWGSFSAEVGNQIHITEGDYNLIQDCDFWDCMVGHTVVQIEGESNIVQGCLFRNLWHRAIALQWHTAATVRECRYNVIEGNIFFDCHVSTNATGGQGIQMAASYNIVRNNLFLFNHWHGLSISIYTEYLEGRYNRVYNNVFWGNGHEGTYDDGFAVHEWNAAANIGNNSMFNNVFAQSTGYEVYVDYQSNGFEGDEYAGNCIYNSGGSNTFYVDGIGANTVAWWESNYPSNVHDNTTSDPTFEDEAGLDFRYAGGSPLPGGGAALTLANGSGSDSTALTVDDCCFFTDGNGMISGDWIQIGTGSPVQISSVSGTSITLSEARTWSDDDPVYWYQDHNGTAMMTGGSPNIGREWHWYAEIRDTVGPQ